MMKKIHRIISISITAITVSVLFITACQIDDSTPIPEADSIEIVSGNEQTAIVLETLANPVVILVKDKNGDAIAGKIVSFTVKEGSVSKETVTTDSKGNASVLWTLGGTIGTQTLEVTVDGLTDTSVVFSATGNPITVTDIDGNIYNAIVIGDQIWMAENLKTTRYADGAEITLVENTTSWDNLNYNDKAMCYYDNSSTNANVYGVLYTWAAAMNGTASSSTNPSNVQGACPDGWHLPSDFEWKELEMYLGMSQPQAYERGYRGTNEGSKLAGNADLWTDNILVSNAEFGTSGFMALPAGYRYSGGTFVGLSTFTGFWSATEESDASHTWDRCLYDNRTDVSRSGGFNTNGFSVRCVMD